MNIELNKNKIPLILKEFFMFYSFRINNCKIDSFGKKYYKLNYTENTSLYNFSKFLKNEKSQYLNIDWLFDYFNIQFTYWDFIRSNKEKNGEKYFIMLHWILGKKALKRYLNRSSRDTYFYHSSFFIKYEIKKSELLEDLKNKNFIIENKENFIEKDKIININPLISQEEILKKEKYNTLEGFYICQEFTTLFRFNSNLCLKCINKIRCKKQLKNRFSELYQKRLANKIILKRKIEEYNNEKK